MLFGILRRIRNERAAFLQCRLKSNRPLVSIIPQGWDIDTELTDLSSIEPLSVESGGSSATRVIIQIHISEAEFPFDCDESGEMPSPIARHSSAASHIRDIDPDFRFY